MRWGLLLIGATVLVGSSCVYDLDPYQSTQGSGGAATTTTGSTMTTTTSTQVSSSSGVGGGLPETLPYCKRDGVATVDVDPLDVNDQSCNNVTFIWRPSSPWSIDELCPKQADGVTVTTPGAPKSAVMFLGATGPWVPGMPRKPLTFKDCYVSLKVGDLSAVASGSFAFVGLVTATDAGDESAIELRVAHKATTTYGIFVDSGRVARAGSSVTEMVGSVDDVVRVGETGGDFIIETKATGAPSWTPIYKVPFVDPQEGDLAFGFGLYFKSLGASTAHFDDYNLD